MAFLIDIGTGLVGKLVDYTVVSVGRQVGYLIYYNRNVESLKAQLDDLVAASQSVEERVATEKRNIREVEVPVKKWLTDVEKISGEAKEILHDEHVKKKWLCGLCPNLVVRHQLSRRSTKLVPNVAELYGKKDFSTFAHAITPQDVHDKDYEAFGSRTSVVNQIMDVLRNSPEINMIGVYGFGGVGKTTLVKEVARQATEDKTLFDDVALILDVKQNPSIQRIQKEIAEKLGLELPESETPAGRARRLSNRIKEQKTLVILDDVWERIDLEAVGLSSVANCKVLLTSRSRDVLSGDMHTRKEFPLDLLGEEETWSLFKKKAGEVIKDPAIKAIAIKVAKRCGGLPVLIVTVASALKNRSRLHAWKDALTRLKRFDGQELTEKSYLALEWSYNQLNDEELKQLFLLCGFYSYSPKIIHIDYLLKYGIGLGLFKNLNTMVEAWDALNSSLEKLKDSCLLIDHEKSGCVKMHDLVYDVAKRILLRDQQVWIVSNGDEFKEWPDTKEFCEKCTMISLEMPSIPKLPEVLRCTQLKLFLVDGNVTEIPCNFFQESTKLGVLDLSDMSIPSLPASLQFLKSLKTLCLDRCILGDIALIGQLQDLELLSFLGSKFRKLPEEIGQLTHLRLLDLTDCSQLELISPGVISNLKRLEELRMRNSFNQWEAEGVFGTEKINASLSELEHLSELSTLYVHILDASILPSNLFSNAVERFQIYIGATWNWDDEDADLNRLKIKLTTAGNELYQSGLNMLLKKTDELHLDGTEAGNNSAYQLDGEVFQQLKQLHVHSAEFRHIINGKGVSHNLKKLAVGGLNGSRFLLTSSMARSLGQLTHLEVSGCRTMEEIVLVNESDEKHMKDMFSKLQHLQLEDLPILTRFCSRSCTKNPSLEILQLENDTEIEERDSREELGNALFDEKVVFPILKRLIISGLAEIKTVWHNRLSQENLRNLETLKIKSCKSLKSVFPCSMVTSLEQLMNLEVIDCGVEEIVANEDGVQATPQFLFPNVVSVDFWNLPHLCCFYLGMHVSSWPSLEDLLVQDCYKISFLAQECSSFKRNCETSVLPTPTDQTLFLINKDSFPNLKKLVILGMEIWEGPLTVNFFSKLEIFEEGGKHSESAAILEKFPNAVGALTHLNKLWLNGMPKLMHLGEDNSQIAGQNFPNLKILGIEGCGSLRNLRSSAISFKNLTELLVNGCSGLEYLLNYSIAKSLMQLQVLSVENCAKMVEIVRSTEDNDDSGNEIVFSRLTYLQLSNLPKLQGFFSRDHCTVEFPLLKTLSISKRLKLKIFHYNETLLVTNEEDDTDVDSDDGDTDIASDDVDNEVDSDDGQTYVDSDTGETVLQVAKENVDIDTGGDGEQIDEITHITNEKEAENCDRSVTTKNVDCIKNREHVKEIDSDADCQEIGESAHITNKITEVTFDGSEHVQALEITATDDQGVIATEEENLASITVGEVTTSVFPVIESPPFTEVEGEQRFSGPNLETVAEETRHVEEQSEPYEPSTAATETPTPITRALAPLSSSKSSGSTRSLKEKFQALSTVHIVQTGANCGEIDETTHVINKNTEANFDGPELVQPLKTTVTHQRVKVFGISCLLFSLFMWISFILYFQGVTSPILEENIAIIPVGEFTTVFPVIEPSPFVVAPHTEEVGKQAFSGPNLEPLDEDARSDVHQTPNAPSQHVKEQSDHFEPSAAVTDAPTPIIPTLPPPSPPKSSGVKRSLREKLQALSAKKAASSSGLPEEVKTKLKALIATANLKEPHTRQQLLALLSSLQLSSTKWIADLAVQDLSKLQLVLDKEESLCQELAALIAQDAKLDVRSHILLSEGNLAEENIQKVQEHKVELLDIEEQIKKLEARATSLRDVIALLEKSNSGFEASLDQLVEEHQLNQLSVDSTSQELLRTRAESDSLCTAIFTYLGQLLM